MAEFKYLFEDTRWGTVSARFVRLVQPPPAQEISNVNLVPYTDEGWVILRLRDGSVEVPGGTLEAGETYLHGLARELLEEAGAVMLSFRPIGAWRCRSSAPAPYKAHLPHPDFYRFVGVGQVELIGLPTNPAEGEDVERVETLSLSDALKAFREGGRPDLADLYQLAAELRDESG